MPVALPYGRQVNIINWRGDDLPWNSGLGLVNIGDGQYLGGWTTFDYARAVISVCGPGRMAGFTGLFPQRHHMWDNGSGRDCDFNQCYFVDLAKRGYRNGLIGKFLNGYGETGGAGFTTTVPFPGVHWMRAFYGNPNYFENNFMTQAGVLVGGRDEPDNGDHNPGAGQTGDTYYYPRLWREQATAFLATVPIGQPWSLYIGDKASHVDDPGDGSKVVYRESIYQNTNITWTDDPSFGLDPQNGTTSQPQFMVNDAEKTWDNTVELDARQLQKNRLRALRSSDDSLKLLIDLVVSRGELANTLIILSGDQTDYSGQWRITGGKNSPHWGANRLALRVRRPVANGAANNACFARVMDPDIATSIRDACGAVASKGQEGMSFLPLLTAPDLEFRRSAPYYNLNRAPEIGGLNAPGKIYGRGVAGTKHEGTEFCWTDYYNINNSGPNPELSRELDAMLDLHGRG